jgi:hypothetical protein
MGNNSQSGARMAKLHPQCRPTPERKRVLNRPVQGLSLELEVKVPEELGENQTHFGIG